MKFSRRADNDLLWLALLLLVLLSGCGATRPSKYYQLTVPANEVPATAPSAHPVKLLIGPIRASHLYHEDHIVYSLAGESMGTYEFERWAEPPTEMIQEILLRELHTSGSFENAEMLRSNSRGEYVLSGRLFDFKEVSATPLVARLTMEMDLRDLKTGSIVWSHYYTHDEPVAKRTVSAVVAALDRNVQQTVSEVKRDLDHFFSNQQP